MNTLNRVAAVLAGALAGMSMVLLLILAGSLALGRRRGEDPDVVRDWGFLAIHGAGLAWPLFVLIAAAGVCLIAILLRHRQMRSWRRGEALLLGVVALNAGRMMGMGPPTSHTGVFAGKLVYGSFGIRPEIFLLCEDSAHPLPRGADLAGGAVPPDVPMMVAVSVPRAGWAGSHPRDWPDTRSDSHGTLYWLVRVRGTLTGPGQYGWPPVVPYRLRVDSVLHVAPSRTFQDECGVVDPEFQRAPDD